MTIPPKQIDDSSMLPVKIDNPKYKDWLNENLIALVCICLHISKKDTRLIKDEVIPKKAWETLKVTHQPSGVLSQLTLLQQALALQYSRE
jgi:hypothetical protein